MQSLLYRIPVIAVLTATLSLSAQKPPAKFGDISMENLKMVIYPADSSAPAFYIFDFGKAYFNYSTFALVLEYHARIKILNSNGFEYADLSIPHDVKNTVQRFKAATYNLVDGKIVTSKVTNSMKIDEKVTDNLRNLKISFPDVREGSIIEYSYIIERGDYVHLLPWNFQTDIPVIRSEFNLQIPEYFNYKYITAGYETVDESTRESTVEQGSIPAIKYHWAMNNIPALKLEPHMPESRNYYSRIEFELQSLDIPGQVSQNYLVSWSSYEKNLMEDKNFVMIGDNLRYLQDTVNRLISGITENSEKIRVIHDYITEKITWNGRESKYTDYTPVKLFKEGKASSAAINFAYIGLLKAAGLDPKPVILSTRDNGVIRDYSRPVEASYNYVIGYVKEGEKEYLLDATDKYLGFDQLPVHCINGKGRIIDGEQSRWIDLSSSSDFSESVMMNLSINESGQLEGKSRFIYEGLSAGKIRKELNEKGKEKFIKGWKESHGVWMINTVDLNNPENMSSPLTINITFAADNYIQDMEDLIMFNPVISGGWKENPFKGEQRIFPIDFVAPISQKYLLMFKIPDGYEVDEIPKSVRFVSQDKSMQFIYGARIIGTELLQVTCQLNIGKAVYTQLDYNEIRKFFELVVSKQAENVLLKKKV